MRQVIVTHAGVVLPNGNSYDATPPFGVASYPVTVISYDFSGGNAASIDITIDAGEVVSVIFDVDYGDAATWLAAFQAQLSGAHIYAADSPNHFNVDGLLAGHAGQVTIGTVVDPGPNTSFTFNDQIFGLGDYIVLTDLEFSIIASSLIGTSILDGGPILDSDYNALVDIGIGRVQVVLPNGRPYDGPPTGDDPPVTVQLDVAERAHISQPVIDAGIVTPD